MPFFPTPQAFDALTANGDAEGYVTVASNANYYPGARVWLRGTATAPKEYVVTDLVGSTKVGLREVLERDGGARYGRTPVTQWTTADAAKISQEPGQPVSVEWAHVKKPVP